MLCGLARLFPFLRPSPTTLIDVGKLHVYTHMHIHVCMHVSIYMNICDCTRVCRHVAHLFATILHGDVAVGREGSSGYKAVTSLQHLAWHVTLA